MIAHFKRLSWITPVAFSLTLFQSHAETPRTEPAVGIREHLGNVHALTNARIVIEPGNVLERGTVVFRDGMITSISVEPAVPADARIWDMQGKTVYPGLIDAFGEVGVESAGGLGQPYWNSLISPQLEVADRLRVDATLNEKLRSQGITARLVAPANGVIKGTSCLVTTGTGPTTRTVLKRQVAQHIRLTVSRGRGREYPNSPMGAVALARQAMYDAQWYEQAWNAYRGSRTESRPEQNDALAALTHSIQGGLVVVDSSHELAFLRAHDFAQEFGLNILIRGSGQEYQRLDAIRDTGRAVIVPVNFPRAPYVSSAEAGINASLADLMHWDHAPENAGRLSAAGVRIALTSYGLSDPAKFLASVRRAVRRGLSPDAALRALTLTPAELYGMADRLGTIEVGKAANVVICDGDLFEEKTKVAETWIDGQRFEVAKASESDVRGNWVGAAVLPDGKSIPLAVVLDGKAENPTGSIRRMDSASPTPAGESAKSNDEQPKVAEQKVKLDQITFRDGRLTAQFSAKDVLGSDGVALVTVVPTLLQSTANWQGQVTFPDGTRAEFAATRTEVRAGNEESTKSNDAKSNEAKSIDGKSEKKQDRPASFAVNYPLGSFGQLVGPEQPALVCLKNATIWTCGPDGVIENGTVVFGAGKILAVGKNVEAPVEALVIDASGKHVSPGIIDCHSHMGTDGGVNEGAQAITAEVRISDFINCDDIDIYRQLAGGVTLVNILHGSANPIGGQNQVIKLRWGALPNALKFKEAPAGIKFALGENVKQSNSPEPTNRYPQSRMGVEQIMRDEFSAALDYQRRWKAWRESGRAIPPRRDLELDAIVEILDKTRWIHCHSYRQDEILALLRVLDGFGVRVGTLQHILEGYKVADEMARHGAMGSSFSDWWNYKFEVLDAIPYNGALMHQQGVVVSFNSDDRELARHLNHEAAKAVKYGDVSPAEALKFVTLNPAKQLRIDQYVGSLEPGKHADLVVWSQSPLSTMSRCEQTWVDGRRYFSLYDDQRLRDESRKMKSALIQKVLSSGETTRSADELDVATQDLWPMEDEVCHPHYAY